MLEGGGVLEGGGGLREERVLEGGGLREERVLEGGGVLEGEGEGA